MDEQQSSEGSMSIWGVREGYRFVATEIVKETDKTVFFIDQDWARLRETRGAKSSFVDWRGTESQARLVAEKLNSANAERARRRQAAEAWFKTRKAEILAQGTEARSGETAQTGPTEGDGPLAKPCAQPEQSA